MTLIHPISTLAWTVYLWLFFSRNDPIFISVNSCLFCSDFLWTSFENFNWSISIYNDCRAAKEEEHCWTFFLGSITFSSHTVYKALRLKADSLAFGASFCSGWDSFANKGDCFILRMFFLSSMVLRVWHSWRTFLKMLKLVTSSLLMLPAFITTESFFSFDLVGWLFP